MSPSRIAYAILLAIGAITVSSKKSSLGVFAVAAIFYMLTAWLI